MNKPETNIERHRAKREAIYEAAATVFAQYGFRRTTMNDIAQAAGISRPALYLMFDNKENLFQGLAAFRLDQAIEQALGVLAGGGDTNERIIAALLVFERIFYEPIADSPHGAELMDISQSLASELMMKDIVRLHAALAKTLSDAEQAGEVNFENSPLKPKAFVELLFTGLNGVKKKASNTAEFRKMVKQLAEVFLQSVSK
ncbi:MAG: TetR/AcrR family transcriptional regulator [Pseudomonadales bacterium]|jgi:AcrR family transcriptional regulator|nr:TetR/AcrR family transcriptional regulator [Pseudomonadales bacterium]